MEIIQRLKEAYPDADCTLNYEEAWKLLVSEMTNMIDATRAFEANVTVMNSTKGMALKALDIGQS